VSGAEQEIAELKALVAALKEEIAKARRDGSKAKKCKSIVAERGYSH
jgi:hypothetical protein